METTMDIILYDDGYKEFSLCMPTSSLWLFDQCRVQEILCIQRDTNERLHYLLELSMDISESELDLALRKIVLSHEEVSLFKDLWWHFSRFATTRTHFRIIDPMADMSKWKDDALDVASAIEAVRRRYAKDIGKV